MESDSEDEMLIESIESKRSRLLSLRLDAENLSKDWDRITPFEEKEILLASYLHVLFVNTPCIYTNVNDVTADLNILQDLKPQLERDMADGRRNYIENLLASLYAIKKVGMMLQKLDSVLNEGSVCIPDDFRRWIQEKLASVDWKEKLQFVASLLPLQASVDWKGKHQFVDSFMQLQEDEEEFADQVRRVEQLDVEVDVEKENPIDIKRRLMEYLEEEEAVNRRPQRNADCYTAHGKAVLRSIEDVIRKLENALSEMKIKEERPEGSEKNKKNKGRKRRRKLAYRRSHKKSRYLSKDR